MPREPVRVPRGPNEPSFLDSFGSCPYCCQCSLYDYNTPGPGRYSLPSEFGVTSWAKQNPTRRRSLSYAFGKADRAAAFRSPWMIEGYPKPDPPKSGPPNAYAGPDEWSSFPSDTAKYKTYSELVKHLGGETNPVAVKQAIAWWEYCKRQSGRYFKWNSWLGQDQCLYEEGRRPPPRGGEGRRPRSADIDVARRRSPAWGFGTADRFPRHQVQRERSPSPGDYVGGDEWWRLNAETGCANCSRRARSSSPPRYSFGMADRGANWLLGERGGETPGPGAYLDNNGHARKAQVLTRPASPSWSFGVRTGPEWNYRTLLRGCPCYVCGRIPRHSYDGCVYFSGGKRERRHSAPHRYTPSPNASAPS